MTEHYTDYHPGTRGLPFEYLRALRIRWQCDPEGKSYPPETVDLLLYVIKNNLTSDPDALLAATETARLSSTANMSAHMTAVNKQFENYSCNKREFEWLRKRCLMLEDHFRGDGGIAVQRVWPSEKYM